MSPRLGVPGRPGRRLDRGGWTAHWAGSRYTHECVHAGRLNVPRGPPARLAVQPPRASARAAEPQARRGDAVTGRGGGGSRRSSSEHASCVVQQLLRYALANGRSGCASCARRLTHRCRVRLQRSAAALVARAAPAFEAPASLRDARGWTQATAASVSAARLGPLGRERVAEAAASSAHRTLGTARQTVAAACSCAPQGRGRPPVRRGRSGRPSGAGADSAGSRRVGLSRGS